MRKETLLRTGKNSVLVEGNRRNRNLRVEEEFKTVLEELEVISDSAYIFRGDSNIWVNFGSN